MRLALSPYHLTTREPALMAALLLGEQLVTMLPVPAAGIEREQVAQALHRHPTYARLLESWRWSIPLWNASVIVSLDGGRDAIDAVRAASRRIAAEPAWLALKPFLHPGLFDDEPRPGYLDALCTDLLKGGPDPGVSLPIACGLDAFARQVGLVSTRAGSSGPGRTTSAAGRTDTAVQQAERRLGSAVCSLAIPVLTQASGATVLWLRAALASELATLRSALARAASGEPGGQVAQVREAAAEYAEAFSALVADRLGRDDDDGRQVLDGYVRVEARRLPADAALIAALAAWRQVRPTSSPPAARGVGARADGSFLALIVEPMSLRPNAPSETDGARTAQRAPR